MDRFRSKPIIEITSWIYLVKDRSSARGSAATVVPSSKNVWLFVWRRILEVLLTAVVYLVTLVADVSPASPEVWLRVTEYVEFIIFLLQKKCYINFCCCAFAFYLTGLISIISVEQQELDISKELTATTECRGRELNRNLVGFWASALPLSYPAILLNNLLNNLLNKHVSTL